MDIKETTNKSFTPNLENLPLTEYFANLPKAKRKPLIISAPKEEVINAIAKATKRNPHTVRCWMLGYSQPNSFNDKSTIAEILQSDVKTLFPKR